MKNSCLYCYGELQGETDFHEKCALSFFGLKRGPVLDYTLSQMSELAKSVVERSVSVPGVQAKLSLTLVNESKGRTNGRLTVVGALGGNYIFKPPSEIYPEMPQNEHLTMRIAESYGIKVVPSSLIRLKSGELSYISKRIDRQENGRKVHMIDMFQVLEAYDKYKSSMERIGNALGKWSINPLLDKLLFFELSLFSFLTGNNDMHLKNFSMIESSSGWILSPAYDLLNATILNPSDDEELALPLEEKKRRLSLTNFRDFGLKLGLTETQINGVLRRFTKNRVKASTLIGISFLSDKMKTEYEKLLNERYIIINE